MFRHGKNLVPVTESFPLMYERPGPAWSKEHWERMCRQGVRMLHLDATCSEDLHNPELRAYLAPGQWDFSAQAARWQHLLQDTPEARLCLRLYVTSPPWWDEAYPEELQLFREGESTTPLGNFRHTTRQTLPSLASTLWREHSALSLQHLLRWLEESGWAERVWGMLIGYGITWEWGILGSYGWLDYSLPMERFWQRYLEDEFGSIEECSRALGIQVANWEEIAPPSPQDRLLADENQLRSSPAARRAAWWQRCLSDCNADYLLHLAGVIREASGQRYQLGAFYGYTLTARAHDPLVSTVGAGGLQGGHHALARGLRSGLLDCLASPYAYGNRELADGLLISHYPLRSVQAAGLRGYEENDLWSHTNPADSPFPLSRGEATNLEDAVQHQRRALAQAVVRNSSYWWTDLTRSAQLGYEVSNFSDPVMLAEIKLHQQLYNEWATPGSESQEAAIAIVISEQAKDFLGLSSTLFLDEVYEQMPAWSWCGSPVDYWLLETASIEELQPYRLIYVFAPWLDASGRALLEGLKDNHRHLWWGPFTGALTAQGYLPDAFCSLTGFTTDTPASPGTLPRCHPMANWTSWYGASAGLSSVQLAEVAGAAGVHRYGDPPLQVMKRGDLLSAQSHLPELTLRVPGWQSAEDLFSRESFHLDQPVPFGGRTRLLHRTG